jgi:hypothetical protein
MYGRFGSCQPDTRSGREAAGRRGPGSLLLSRLQANVLLAKCETLATDDEQSSSGRPTSLLLFAQRSSGLPRAETTHLLARPDVRRLRGACRQLSLSRGVRRRPRSQRGIGTGSRIDSRGLWSAARASRFGRSCGSRCCCHAGLDGVAASWRGVAGGGLFLPSLMVRAPWSRVPRADHLTANLALQRAVWRPISATRCWPRFRSPKATVASKSRRCRISRKATVARLSQTACAFGLSRASDLIALATETTVRGEKHGCSME